MISLRFEFGFVLVSSRRWKWESFSRNSSILRNFLRICCCFVFFLLEFERIWFWCYLYSKTWRQTFEKNWRDFVLQKHRETWFTMVRHTGSFQIRDSAFKSSVVQNATKSTTTIFERIFDRLSSIKIQTVHEDRRSGTLITGFKQKENLILMNNCY